MDKQEFLKNLGKLCEALFDEVVEFQTGEMAASFIAGVGYGFKAAANLVE